MERKTKAYPEEGIALWEWRVKEHVPRDAFAFLAGVSHNVVGAFEVGKRLQPGTAEAIFQTWECLKADKDMLNSIRCRTKPPRIGAFQKGGWVYRGVSRTTED